MKRCQLHLFLAPPHNDTTVLPCSVFPSRHSPFATDPLIGAGQKGGWVVRGRVRRAEQQRAARTRRPFAYFTRNLRASIRQGNCKNGGVIYLSLPPRGLSSFPEVPLGLPHPPVRPSTILALFSSYSIFFRSAWSISSRTQTHAVSLFSCSSNWSEEFIW